MMPPSPSHGVVALACLDLRHRPDHRSELKSQLLLGEVVRVLSFSRDRQWWRVENRADRYRGWIRAWGVVAGNARRVASWERRARARVVLSHAEVRTQRRGGALVSPLFWSCRLIAGRARAGYCVAELPDGRRGWVDARAVGIFGNPQAGLLERVRSLLGVPYLWGGRTALALDCSAFTQLVLAEQGVWLPRDAEQQFEACRALPAGREPRAGDLLFFGRARGRLGHVGLALGGGYYAHARGRVRINSLDIDNLLYDKELSDQFRGFGRPSRGRSAGAKRGKGVGESA